MGKGHQKIIHRRGKEICLFRKTYKEMHIQDIIWERQVQH